MRLFSTLSLVVALLAVVPRAGFSQAAADPSVRLSDSAAPARTGKTAGRLSNAGAYRAAAQVESVFVERLNRSAVVDGGDFASYLVARLGVRPVPDSLAIDVVVDTQAVRIGGRVQDLPPEVRRAFGPALMFVDPSSVIQGHVVLHRAGAGMIRFHLNRVTVNGFPIPETILAPLMAEVGARYPVLTKTGRDLLVAIPEDGVVTLRDGAIGVAIHGQTAATKRP